VNEGRLEAVQMHCGERIQAQSKFRLRIELYAVVFGLLVFQALLMKKPPLDMLVTVLTVVYIGRLCTALA
jgi:hypothetical protein